MELRGIRRGVFFFCEKAIFLIISGQPAETGMFHPKSLKLKK